MGEAKRRAQARDAWWGSLSPDGRVVAEVAQRIFDRLVAPSQAIGMCYRLAFFLEQYLAVEHGISVEAVVGYVNDGTDDVMISHAWIEFEGQRTDLSLANVQHPHAQSAGEVLIMGNIARAGQRYSYHRERSLAGLVIAQELMQDPKVGAMVLQKEEEHLFMVARTKSADLRRSYLDGAPDGLNFERLAALVG